MRVQRKYARLLRVENHESVVTIMQNTYTIRAKCEGEY